MCLYIYLELNIDVIIIIYLIHIQYGIQDIHANIYIE